MQIKSRKLKNVTSVFWNSQNSSLVLLDQRVLPWDIKFNEYHSVKDVSEAIKNMVVRGAPAIGVTAAYAMVLSTIQALTKFKQQEKRIEFLKMSYQTLISSRPTAVDLENFAKIVLEEAINTNLSVEKVLNRAHSLRTQVIEECKKIGIEGEKIIKNGETILTHCNAGAPATVDYGTALAPIYVAHSKQKKIRVIVDETRPRLQGARITAWELYESGIEHLIITDNSASFLMSKGEIDKIIVGADRCLQDGTIANKIGTLSLAISAKYFGIDFYVALPWSTIDQSGTKASKIAIEKRDEEEVKFVTSKEQRILISNEKSSALNYAFDVTPAKLIKGYITSKGVLTLEQLKKVIKKIKKE
ncbi:MAG: S-methyl-5-thioribose-1-phosphate isomerase [Candidatus Heimdallarchaeum endolithica]|uniref:S-methyl-5-thioribose-1-phosphate isomerase n=1 Tax=Candidatus Heimdallarchaeum endolithica TaxID=2876572 RepID=A0A9Y1BRH8_9ARCH|nr:MAG: S-methyl-5-thioribose-1-phosphate isomerase [Candidatus Heimdallarchaeum endolithica]